jgi:hypothetical protein
VAGLLWVVLTLCVARGRELSAGQATLMAADGAVAEAQPKRIYHMGFLDDYRCTGRVFDEPRRWRMKCEHNPRRLMQCRCSSAAEASPLMHCECDSPVTNVDGKTAPLSTLERPETILAMELPEPAIV